MSASPADLYALVPCAGVGERAGARGPKQYAAVAGKPMVQHTLEALAKVQRLRQTLVVLSPQDDAFDQHVPGTTAWVARIGGASRAQSVANGLADLLARGAQADDWVLVHDAARCLVTPTQIEALIAACEHDAVGGLLAHRLPDTLKVGSPEGRVAATLTRADKWLAQTPQMFRIGMLLDALERAGDAVTDEASAIESVGLAPLLVPGSAQNFKLTFSEDFALAEALLKSRK
jgi:2-C-methyl-D-erythritol 4-phosphate cytidylyltransferase